MKARAKFEPQLDLLEARRHLATLRSMHSQDRRVTGMINRLLSRLAPLRHPDSPAHERRLIQSIAKTTHAVDRIISIHEIPVDERGQQRAVGSAADARFGAGGGMRPGAPPSEHTPLGRRCS